MRIFFYIASIVTLLVGVLMLLEARQTFGGHPENIIVFFPALAIAFFLIGRLFRKPDNIQLKHSRDQTQDYKYVVEHTAKVSTLEKLAWIATIAAAVIAGLALFFR